MLNKADLTKPYFIKAEEVTSDKIEAALHVMKRPEFTYSQFGGALYRAGVTWNNHERAGDRVLQRARKMGLVRHAKGKWHAIPEAWATLS